MKGYREHPGGWILIGAALLLAAPWAAAGAPAPNQRNTHHHDPATFQPPAREPLVYWRQIDGYIASWASEVAVRELGLTRHVAGLAVAADATRLLAAFELRVTVPEAFFGLLAANLVLPE